MHLRRGRAPADAEYLPGRCGSRTSGRWGQASQSPSAMKSASAAGAQLFQDEVAGARADEPCLRTPNEMIFEVEDQSGGVDSGVRGGSAVDGVLRGGVGRSRPLTQVAEDLDADSTSAGGGRGAPQGEGPDHQRRRAPSLSPATQGTGAPYGRSRTGRGLARWPAKARLPAPNPVYPSTCPRKPRR